jgi:TM2 domain-containing membrane protein YozV
MAKSWRIRDADPYFYRLGVKRATHGLPFVDDKNPATAFTLSLLFCGAGQSYSGQRIKAALFQTFMFLFLIGTGFILLFRKELLDILPAHAVPFTRVFLALQGALFLWLIFWIWNAVDAYRATAKARRLPFRGVQSSILPALSSLFVPGWGQFMNGQPWKGTLLAVFSVLNLFSLFTIGAVLYAWPLFEPVRARIMVELLFFAALLYAPAIPIISLFSSYDALQVSRDDTKKETLLDRFLLAFTRFQMEGWTRAFGSPTRPLLAALLLAVLILAVRPHVDLSLSYYASRLVDARAWSQDQGMKFLPDMITRLLSIITVNQ